MASALHHPTSPRLRVALTASVFLAACGHAATGPGPAQPSAASMPAVPPLALRPADAARADLVATIVVPTPQRSLDRAAALSQKLGVSGQGSARELLGAGHWAGGAWDKLDLTQPAAMIVLAGPGPGAKSEGVAAVALKPGPDLFATLVKDAGKVAARAGDAVQLEHAENSGLESEWMLARDGVLCVGDTREVLVAGCALAFAARRTLPGDAVVTFTPQGLWRAQGMTEAAGIAQARAELASYAKTAAPSAQAAVALGARLLDAVAEVSEGRLTVTLDAHGLATTFAIVARAGTGLAKTFAAHTPYRLDPAFLVGPPPVSVAAVGDATLARTLWAAVSADLLAAVTAADRAKLAAAAAALLGAQGGPLAARFAFEPGEELAFHYDLACALAADADGKKLLGAVEAAAKTPTIERLVAGRLTGGAKAKIATRRERDVMVTRVTVQMKPTPPTTRADLEGVPFLDGKPVELRVQVAGRRLLAAAGFRAKERLATLATPTATPAAGAAGTPAAGAYAAALADTAGADALLYLDVSASVKPFAAIAVRLQSGRQDRSEAMIPVVAALLERAQLATWISARGGDALAVTWRVPMTTFDTVGSVVHLFFGNAGVGGFGFIR